MLNTPPLDPPLRMEGERRETPLPSKGRGWGWGSTLLCSFGSFGSVELFVTLETREDIDTPPLTPPLKWEGKRG